MEKLTPSQAAAAARYRHSLFLTRLRVHTNADTMKKILIYLHRKNKVPQHLIPERLRYAFIADQLPKGTSTWTRGILNADSRLAIQPLILHFRENMDEWMLNPSAARTDFYSRVA